MASNAGLTGIGNLFDTAREMMTRRDLLKRLAAGTAVAVLPGHGVAEMRGKPITQAIPASGEALPVIGMGSSRTFDLRLDPETTSRLVEVMQIFFEENGTVIDSSPMYGAAESVLGEVLERVEGNHTPFVATKVWTDGRESGLEQMEVSAKRLRTPRIDLMQIHNLRDWKIHLESLEALRERGAIRYIGITTSHNRSHGELLRALGTGRFDFAQFTYNIGNRESEKRLLPAVQDMGIATLINRPFQRGSLFRKVKGKPLPDWAAEIECTSWAQIFLKFVVSHPAVTCAIPATNKPRHMRDNMQAGFGTLPDAAMRQRMIETFSSI